MALPPMIPTSFVPHAPGTSPQRFRSDFIGAFGYLAYTVLGIALLLSLGVFLYAQYLNGLKTAKDNKLAAAQSVIATSTVEGFVRLRNRLDVGTNLLKKHVAFSNFFAALQTLLPTNVRFSSLHLSLDQSGATKIDGSGTAKNFNALAAVSTTFSSDVRIKDVIFSRISINRDNSVSFGLSAALDPQFVAFTPSASAPDSVVPPAPVASTTLTL